MASGAVALGPKLLISYATKDIPIVEALPEPPPTIDGPINILLLGMDARPEDGGSNGARADTIIIAHIPAAHDRIYMVSLPRDLEVEIEDASGLLRTPRLMCDTLCLFPGRRRFTVVWRGLFPVRDLGAEEVRAVRVRSGVASMAGVAVA